MVTDSPERMRILVVDDDPLFIEYVDHVFQLIDLHIQSAKSLSEARHSLRQDTFDIILLDNWLPDGKGILLMEDVKKIPVMSAVIMTTADEGIDNIKRCFEAGIQDYMIKPIQTDVLIHKANLLYRNLLNERELARSNSQLKLAQTAAKAEAKLAQHVYASLVGDTNPKAHGIHKFQLSHGDFCGDFMFSLEAENGNRYVFLADAMGHGLAAAICILPIISIVKAMTFKNRPLLNIVHEVNAKLAADLPDDRFVAMAAIEFNFGHNKISAVNAGLPDLLFQQTDNAITQVRSSSMPLGILGPEQFSIQSVSFDIAKINQIAVFSDGVIEQKNAQGAVIGVSGIKALAEELSEGALPWTRLETVFTEHLGNESREDDITLCVIDTPKLIAAHIASERAPTVMTGDLILNITATGEFLKVLDIVNVSTHVLNESGVESGFANQVFTVIAELYNNALDHGVLQIDSSLKNDVTGFARYLSERDAKLNNLSSDDQISVSLSMRGHENIEFDITDSGSGYQYQGTATRNDLSGRGQALLEGLAQSIERNAEGNRVKAVMQSKT